MLLPLQNLQVCQQCPPAAVKSTSCLPLQSSHELSAGNLVRLEACAPTVHRQRDRGRQHSAICSTAHVPNVGDTPSEAVGVHDAEDLFVALV